MGTGRNKGRDRTRHTGQPVSPQAGPASPDDDTSCHGDSGLTRRRESMLERVAIREGWDIPPDKRRAIVQRLVDDVTSAPSPRDRMNAAKVLVQMDAVEVEAGKVYLSAMTGQEGGGRGSHIGQQIVIQDGATKDAIIQELRRQHNKRR